MHEQDDALLGTVLVLCAADDGLLQARRAAAGPDPDDASETGWFRKHLARADPQRDELAHAVLTAMVRPAAAAEAVEARRAKAKADAERAKEKKRADAARAQARQRARAAKEAADRREEEARAQAKRDRIRAGRAQRRGRVLAAIASVPAAAAAWWVCYVPLAFVTQIWAGASTSPGQGGGFAELMHWVNLYGVRAVAALAIFQIWAVWFLRGSDDQDVEMIGMPALGWFIGAVAGYVVGAILAGVSFARHGGPTYGDWYFAPLGSFIGASVALAIAVFMVIHDAWDDEQRGGRSKARHRR